MIYIYVWGCFNWGNGYSRWVYFILPLVLIIGSVVGVLMLCATIWPSTARKCLPVMLKPVDMWQDLCIAVLRMKPWFRFFIMTTWSLSVFLPILIWRKQSPLGISTWPPAPLSDLLYCSTFGLSFKLSKSFVEITYWPQCQKVLLLVGHILVLCKG